MFRTTKSFALASKYNSKSLLRLTLGILRGLFVKMSDTPNPNFMKFTPTGKTVMDQGTTDTPIPLFSGS